MSSPWPPAATLQDVSPRLPGPATLQDHSGPEGDIPRAMRAFTSSGAPSRVFRFALAEVSGECSPWPGTEGADGRSTLKLCAATDTSTGITCSKIAQALTATDSMLAGGSVGVLLGTGTGSTQQYRVDKFAAQVQ